MMPGWLFVWLVWYLVLLVPVEGQNRGRISIVDNGYRDILISISDDVPENPTLLQEIKSLFKNTSNTLYEITESRAYFRNITILIPKSWQTTEHVAASGEAHDKSDIVVEATSGQNGQGDRPYAIKATPCMEPGFYIKLTDQYILNGTGQGEYYGPKDKVLVHEWAHFRYGVFDERPDYNSDKDQFYAGSNGKILPTKCTEGLTGKMVDKDSGNPCLFEGQMPQTGCRWVDDETMGGKYASLMYSTELDHVVSFCDDGKDKNKKHNSEAPTMQNNMCNGRSVWEVLLDHPDFKGINVPRPGLSTTPTFTVVQWSATRIVLVLDTSGSMSGTRMERLGQGCRNYISNVLADGEYLGIVWFDSDATIKQPVTEVNSQTRSGLIDNIPTSATGGTNIGLGLLEGLKALADAGATKSGQLIVITDGQGTNTRDVFDEVLRSGVIVHTIAVTDNADSSVDSLAEATGGFSFLYQDTDTSNALNEAFKKIGNLVKASTDYTYNLLSLAELVPGNAAWTGTVFVDVALGGDTKFVVDYTADTVTVTLTSPSGATYTETSSACQHDTSFKVYTCTVPGVAESGEWTYHITNQHSQQQRMSLSVTTKPPEGMVPIVARTFWGRRNVDLGTTLPDKQTLYAMVTKKYAPVLHAAVKATVESPGGVVETLQLNDDGVGADTVAEDGIYSAYYPGFTGIGRYSVKTAVNGTDATYISSRPVNGQSGPPTNDELTGRFQRTESGGSFQLTNYIPNAKYYPPGAISDLKVLNASRIYRTVTLQWTAVGAQLDAGQASFYDLRMGDTISDLRLNFTDQAPVTDAIVVEGASLNNPQEAGGLERVVIKIDRIDDATYVFGVVAVDARTDGDVRGPISNIVSVSMAKQPQASDAPSMSSHSGSTEMPYITGPSMSSHSVSTEMPYIAGPSMSSHSGSTEMPYITGPSMLSHSGSAEMPYITALSMVAGVFTLRII